MSIHRKGAFRLAALAALCFAFGAATTNAAEPLESFAPEDFDLTIRVNVRELFDNPDLQDLRSRLIGFQGEQFIDQIAEYTGVDLRADIDTIVLAGYYDKARKKDGVAILRGRWNESDLLAFLEMNEAYERGPVGGEVIHGYWDEKDMRMKYVYFVDIDVMAIGPFEPIKAMAESVDRPGRRFIDHPTVKRLVEAVPPDALAAFVGLRPPKPAKDRFGQMLLDSVDAAGLVLDAKEGFGLSLTLATADAETARAGREILEGLVAVGRLMKERPAVGRLAKQIEVRAEGADVTAGLRFQQNELEDLMALNSKLRQRLNRGSVR